MTILSDKREKFCLLIVSGVPLVEAYRQSRPSGMMTDQTASNRARDLLRRPEVLRRITELRLPAVLEVRKAYKYTLERALNECDQAYSLALALGQPSVMVAAITVKAKIAGLVIDKKEERHGLLDDVTTRELLKMRAALTRAEPSPVRIAAVELVEDHSEGNNGNAGPGGIARFRLAAGAPSTLNRD